MDGRKKLLTLAGVVGILACGACFLPPLPQHKPVPPPMPPALASMHLIDIHVEDGTAGDLFDPLILSKATADDFNRVWKDFPVRAEAFNSGRHSDAALRITVLRKTASCKPGNNSKQFCSFEMIASFTLTAADGRILQNRPQESWKFGFWQQGNSLPQNLNANPFREEAAYALAMTTGTMFLFTEHTK